MLARCMYLILVLEISIVNQRGWLQIVHFHMSLTLTENLSERLWQNCPLIHQMSAFLVLMNRVPSILGLSHFARDVRRIWMTCSRHASRVKGPSPFPFLSLL